MVPLPRGAIYTESKQVLETEDLEFRSDEETPEDSRAGTPDYEIVEPPEQSVQPEKADLPDAQLGLIAGLFDEEINVHPKCLFKVDANQAKVITNALTSLGDVLAVKRTEADHICKMDKFYHDKMDAHLWWDRYSQYCTLKTLGTFDWALSLCNS